MTIIFIIGTMVIWAIYDMYLVLTKKPTISEKITFISKYKSPSIPLLLGYLMGHWFR